MDDSDSDREEGEQEIVLGRYRIRTSDFTPEMEKRAIKSRDIYIYMVSCSNKYGQIEDGQGDCNCYNKRTGRFRDILHKYLYIGCEY